MLVNLEQYYNPETPVYTYNGYEDFINEHISQQMVMKLLMLGST